MSRPSALDLCARAGCRHYRGEHKGICTAPGRMPDGMLVPGTTCLCDGMVEASGRELAGAEYRTDDYGCGTWYLKGRPLVHCDDECLAYENPDMNDPAEVRDAYFHWRRHAYLDGCSHAR